MARVRAGVRRRHASARRRALRASLTAAAPPLVSTYEWTQGAPADRHFAALVTAADLHQFGGDAWPCETVGLAADPAPEFTDGAGCAVYRFGDAYAIVHLHGGWFSVRVAAPSDTAVATICTAFRASYPASYLTLAEDPVVPITFWSMSKWGAQPRLRRVEASPWADIVGNYSADVRDELAEIMGWNDGPGRDGQLLLWQGPPGTGKTWALRALASEWAPWAEFHYITDPDTFFVEDASYMIDVLLADSYASVEPTSGDVYEEEAADGKWRVLILEDTGELLSANAKEKYGQGLSRLLNVVDGMIGQGLRVLALVTTNDELGELAPAVTRPGRCASKLVFGPLTVEEARAWTGNPDAEAGTIAELYAAHGKADDAFPAEEDELVASLRSAFALPVDRPDEPTPSLGTLAAIETCTVCGATDERPNPNCDHCSPWSIKPGRMSDAPDVAALVAEVAQRHQPDEPGYGQTAYDAGRRVVLWVAWDGTSVEEAAAAEAEFLAIDGVDGFESEAESLPSGWWDAEVVYPDDPPRWVLERPDEHALAELERLAALPLEPPAVEPPPGPDLAALLAAAASGLDGLEEALPAADPSALRAALEALAAAHERTVAGVVDAVAALGRQASGSRGDALALTALSVLQTFAAQPAAPPAPPPIVHVTVPERELHVVVERPEPTPAPNVEVFVPQPAPQPAPIVEVHLPEQPAPVVNVTNEVPAAEVTVNVPEPRPTVAVPIRDESGDIVRVEHRPA